VHAQLVLPAGFAITSGANPQNVGTVNWNSPTTATWTVTGPTNTGLYELDVEVWSDNLGVAVDDPADPFHKFDVNVTSHFHVFRGYLYELIRKVFWWVPYKSIATRD
jgi:hypothetical protein